MIYIKVSNIIFEKLLLPYGAKKDYKDIYIYGLQIIILNLLNFIIILTIATLLNYTYETLFFLGMFLPLRIFGRGKHASTRLKCTVIFIMAMFSLIYLGTQFYYLLDNKAIMLSILMITFIMQYFFARNKYKKLRRKYKNRIVQFIPLVVGYLLLIILLSTEILEFKYLLVCILAIVFQSLTLIKKEGI